MRVQASAALALLAGGSTVTASACNDDCVKGFKKDECTSSAKAFCASFTRGGLYRGGLPTFAKSCDHSFSHLSSACACLPSQTAKDPIRGHGYTFLPKTITGYTTVIVTATKSKPGSCR